MKMKKYSYATLALLAAILIAPLLLTACGKSVGGNGRRPDDHRAGQDSHC